MKKKKVVEELPRVQEPHQVRLRSSGKWTLTSMFQEQNRKSYIHAVPHPKTALIVKHYYF